jgi:hypothetical protein
MFNTINMILWLGNYLLGVSLQKIPKEPGW